MVAYSETASDHFRHPRNVGIMPDADAVGVAADAENHITLYLRLRASRVVEARFRALACNACIACASALTVLLERKSEREAGRLARADLLAALDGLPSEKLHCADLALAALGRALAAVSGRE